ncbi:hypothetical protein GC170_11450 [bacterium]|nr:hypothetical protein [bacterium]
MRHVRLSLTALLVLTLSAFSVTQAGELSAQEASAIERSAQRIGETVVDQGHSAADVRRVVTFYVRGEVAKAINHDMPEAPLPASEEGQVSSIVDKVMASLHLVDPVNPSPAPVPQPKPETPVNPVKPAAQPGQQPGPGFQPVIVWVVQPAMQPMPAPVISPVPMPVGPPAFAPLPGWPGGAPTIHIKQGWFGHPDKVWYSRH